jgi:hypothetical protein
MSNSKLIIAGITVSILSLVVIVLIFLGLSSVFSKINDQASIDLNKNLEEYEERSEEIDEKISEENIVSNYTWYEDKYIKFLYPINTSVNVASGKVVDDELNMSIDIIGVASITIDDLLSCQVLIFS